MMCFLYDNIIAILALILSLINYIYSIYIYKRNLFIGVDDVQLLDGIYYFRVGIENRSRLPITITEIDIITDKSTIKLHKYREYNSTMIVHVECGNDIQDDYYTDGFPISFSQFEARNFYFRTTHIDKSAKNHIHIKQIVLYTTRGKIVQNINRTF